MVEEIYCEKENENYCFYKKINFQLNKSYKNQESTIFTIHTIHLRRHGTASNKENDQKTPPPNLPKHAIPKFTHKTTLSAQHRPL